MSRKTKNAILCACCDISQKWYNYISGKKITHCVRTHNICLHTLIVCVHNVKYRKHVL